MASEIKLNGNTFYKKVQKLLKTWNQVILRPWSGQPKMAAPDPG